jgi:hypothetical protein
MSYCDDPLEVDLQRARVTAQLIDCAGDVRVGAGKSTTRFVHATILDIPGRNTCLANAAASARNCLKPPYRLCQHPP